LSLKAFTPPLEGARFAVLISTGWSPGAERGAFIGMFLVLGQKYTSGAEVLFDERPKSRKMDLYDRERELMDLEANVGRPLIILTGIRRIGKTSVLNVLLNESGIPFALIDARSLKRNYGVEDLYRLVARGMGSSLKSLHDILQNVKRIKVSYPTLKGEASCFTAPPCP